MYNINWGVYRPPATLHSVDGNEVALGDYIVRVCLRRCYRTEAREIGVENAPIRRSSILRRATSLTRRHDDRSTAGIRQHIQFSLSLSLSLSVCACFCLAPRQQMVPMSGWVNEWVSRDNVPMYDQRLGDEIMDPQSGAARYLSLRSAEERERERRNKKLSYRRLIARRICAIPNDVADFGNTSLLPHMCYHAEFGCSVSKVKR